MRVSRLASADEIKRSYRRLASRYHPDVNPSPDAHYILIEINEAYSILGDPSLKWMYDQQFSKPQSHVFYEDLSQSANEDPRKRRHGRKETEEDRERKREFAKVRNISFNKKMRILSYISLIISALIFIDHYLPLKSVYKKAYANFSPQHVDVSKGIIYSVFLENGRQINMLPKRMEEEVIGLRRDEGLFMETPILHLPNYIRVGNVVFRPIEGLYDLMLFYGVICLSSIFVLGYKLENSMVLPGILTFFNNIFVLAFFILWLSE